MRLRAVLIIILMACAVVAAADDRWIAFTDDTPYTEARIETSRSGAEVVEFDLVIPGVSVEQVTTANGDFARLAIPGMGRIGDIGAPELPAFRRFVEIPHSATATVTTTVLDRATLSLENESLPGLVYPVQLPMPKCDCAEARAWTFSHEAKAYKGVVGADATGLEGPYAIRDHTMMMLIAAPVAYNVDAGTVEIATRLRVTVDIVGGDAAKTAAVKERLSSRHFDAWLRDAAINLNLPDAGGWAYPDDAPVEFLIITPPQFVPDLAPFVEWKTSTGYSMNVVTTNTTGTSTDDIKTYIEGLYAGPNPPVYILMIGDSPTPLDTYTPSGGGAGGSDLPFVQMDTDIYPDMMIARWPIDDSAELINMRDKILHYERPTAANSAWLDNALFLAGDEYVDYVTTHEEVIAQVMEPAPNSANCDLWYHADSPTTSELIADLNTGRAWMVYSAHCSSTGMGGNPPFHSGDVPTLANPNLYPIAIGHCCDSNPWATGGDVFGEVMVTQADKGFVSYWGASNNSNWAPDDWIEKGFFDSMFDADIAGNIGDVDQHYSNIAACYAGLSEVTLQGGDDDRNWHMYNLNGDPTLDPFTRFPIAMTVGAPTVVPPVADTFSVTVTDPAAVPLAMVAVTQNGVLLGAGLTDDTGTAAFPIDVPTPGSDLLVRVTAHNHLPTDETTLVAAGSDGVVLLDGTLYRCDSPVVINVFDDDLSGDPPFNVTLSASPSGGSVLVQLTDMGTPGVVQFQGGVVLGTDLVVAHGDTLTVTYIDADTGAKTSGTLKTDSAVLDCAGPAIGTVVIEETSAAVTISFTTDEDGTSEAVWGTSQPPTNVVSSSALVTDHQVVVDGLGPCTKIYFELRSTDALGNVGVNDNDGSFHQVRTTSGTRSLASTDTPLAIPDANTDGVTSTVTVDSAFSVQDVEVKINITHTWDADLDITLISPDGIRVDLTSDNGSSGDNFVDTVFDDDATTLITDGSAPFTGSFQPEQPLAALNGLPAGGTWSLEVVDDAGSDLGTLNGWVLMLEINEPPCDNLFTDGFESGNCGLWSTAVGELP